MLSIHRWKKSILILSIVSMLLALSGCGLAKIPGQIQSSTDRALARLDQAIVELANANADWQQILTDLASDLPAELQSTIGFEVSRTLNRAISASGSEVKCIVDFLRERVREDLIRIRADLLNLPIPPLSPVFCDVESVDMAMVNDGRQNNLLIYGYNFDVQNPVQILLNENGQEVDVNAEQKNLFVLTHYKMELNLGRNGVPLSSASQYFVIRWGEEIISEIPIKQPLLPACKVEEFAYQPPAVYFRPEDHTQGDRDFDGSGPRVSVKVNLWPQISQDLEITGWDLEVEMSAKETESDWTTVGGYTRISDFVSFPPGYVVDHFTFPVQSHITYVDGDHEIDNFPPTDGGPVNSFEFVGDTDGSEAGTETSVTIHFNTLKFQLKQVGNCR